MVVWSALIGFYGLLQLFALGFLWATISWRTLVRAVLVGLYTCTAAAYPLEFLAVHALGLAGVSNPVTVASYTIDPVIEEVVKAAPLLFLVLRSGATLGITDLLLLGAGLGLGFRFAEEWLRLTRGIDPGLPPLSGLLMWLPSGQQTDISIAWGSQRFPLGISGALVWSGMVGLGIGLSRYIPGPKIVQLIVPILALSWMAFDHALVNFSVAHAVGTVVGVSEFAWPARLLFTLDGFGRAIPFYLLGGLIVALWLDHRRGGRLWRGASLRLFHGLQLSRPGVPLILVSGAIWIAFLTVFVVGTLPVAPEPLRVQRLFANPGTAALFVLAAALAVAGIWRFAGMPVPETADSDARVRYELGGLLSVGVLGAIGLGLWAGLSKGAADFLFHGGAHLYDAAGGTAPVTIVAGTAPGSTVATTVRDQRTPPLS